jgi:predicted Fe-S protein YdhL (DUF1289 family)
MNSRTRLCDGCFRTLEEIAGWMNYSRAEKEAVLMRLDDRRDAATADLFSIEPFQARPGDQ